MRSRLKRGGSGIGKDGEKGIKKEERTPRDGGAAERSKGPIQEQKSVSKKDKSV